MADTPFRESDGVTRRMRIGIDAHIIGKQKGGVETVLDNIIRTLARLDPDNQYFIYITKKCPWPREKWPANFHLRLLPVENPWLERLIVLPLYYWKDCLDVVHVQRALPLWGCRRSVLHVHDVLYVTHPELFSRWRRMILARIFRRSIKQATRILVPSATTRDEIVRTYPIDSNKIVVIPNGVDTSKYSPLTDQSHVASTACRLGIRLPYVIFLGAIERNKNIDTLLKSFAEFRRTCRDFQLVFVGKLRSETKNGYWTELKQKVRQLDIESSVKFTGYLNGEECTSLLRGAQMLVFPSIAEGFGLPPLESMACGVPVIVSNLPVFREIYGDAVLMTEPQDSTELASLMVRLATEEGLAEILRQKGLKKATAYSWEFASTRLVDVYRSTASRDTAS